MLLHTEGMTLATDLMGADKCEVFAKILSQMLLVGADRTAAILNLYRRANDEERAILDALLVAMTDCPLSQIIKFARRDANEK